MKERRGATGQKPQRGSSFPTLLTNFPALGERERMTDHRTFRLIAHQSEMVVFGTRRQHIPSISAAQCRCRELIPPPSPRQPREFISTSLLRNVASRRVSYLPATLSAPRYRCRAQGRHRGDGSTSPSPQSSVYPADIL